MISIITTVYGQLEMNRLFLESIRKYTINPYELIVIDNNSSDGSAEFFEKNGAVLIRNNSNYSYPFTQNQGIKKARFDYMAFFNNDLILGPGWDEKLIASMKVNDLEVITTCGPERVENKKETKKLRLKWKLIRNIFLRFGTSERNLWLMFKLMYPDWDAFCRKRAEKFKQQVKEGILGHSVFMHKSAIDKIGIWDEHIQDADFDIFMRTKKRSIEYGDIKPIHYALDVYNHHYIRLTVGRKKNKPQFADGSNLIRLEDKWNKEEMQVLLKDSYHK